MLKYILGYAPATVIPAAVSFLMIYAYTRLLSPDRYGEFSLAFAIVQVVQTIFFFAIPVALSRFYPEAATRNREQAFLTECYTLFYLLGIIVAILVCAATLLPISLSSMSWALVAILLLGRSAVVLNQSVNRITFRMGRYNTIECTHSLLGLGLGLVFVILLGGTAEAPMLGLAAAASLCMLADGRPLMLPFRHGRQPADRAMLKRLVAFAMPLIIVDAAVCLLQLSDRFLLDGLSGPHALGIYAIAYNLVERPISLICTAISTATFPVAVQMVHDHGTTLGARQASRNGAILFALALPACIGLAMTAPYVTAAMVGPDFRSGVQALVPVLCVAALFRGLSTHWVDHIFHLSGRTDLALWVYAPFAVANIGLNAVLIPRYGALGAAYASVACQAGALATGWTVGRRTFPVPFPLVEVIKICGAASVMALALYVVSFSPSWVGLLESVPVGATIFLAAALLLKIGNGQQTLRVLARRLLDMMNLGRGRAVL